MTRWYWNGRIKSKLTSVLFHLGHQIIINIIIFSVNILCKYSRSIFRIYGYDTVSTDDGVLVIGGATDGSPYQISTVAEYKDGSWRNIGNLARNRFYHKSIKLGSNIMILGGTEYNPGVARSNMNVEIWNLDTNTSQIIDSTFTFPNHAYSHAVALPIDPGFCSRNWNYRNFESWLISFNLK